MGFVWFWVWFFFTITKNWTLGVVRARQGVWQGDVLTPLELIVPPGMGCAGDPRKGSGGTQGVGAHPKTLPGQLWGSSSPQLCLRVGVGFAGAGVQLLLPECEISQTSVQGPGAGAGAGDISGSLLSLPVSF